MKRIVNAICDLLLLVVGLAITAGWLGSETPVVGWLSESARHTVGGLLLSYGMYATYEAVVGRPHPWARRVLMATALLGGWVSRPSDADPPAGGAEQHAEDRDSRLIDRPAVLAEPTSPGMSPDDALGQLDYSHGERHRPQPAGRRPRHVVGGLGSEQAVPDKIRVAHCQDL